MNLIFDIDGTLWDTRPEVAEHTNLFFDREGISHPHLEVEDFTPLFGKTTEQIADVLLQTIPAPERYAIMERCVDSELGHLAQCSGNSGYPGLHQTLEALAKVHTLYIVSNCQLGYPELTMEKLGITGLFRDFLCYGQTGTPKGETIRTLMARHGMTRAVYIGDTQSDYEATRFAGIPFVWAAYGMGHPEAFEAKIDTLSQLTELDLETL